MNGEPLSGRRCAICGSDDLTEDTWIIAEGGLICGACLREPGCPITASMYRGRGDAPRPSLRDVYAGVVAFKEASPANAPDVASLGPALAEMLARSVLAVAATYGLPDDTLLTPVPSFRHNRTHMRTLCTLAARALPGVRLASVLEKTRDFRQATLGAAARRAASAGAYRVRKSVRRRVVIVANDIVTTGTTLGACAAALRAAGADAVFGAAIVRAIRAPRQGLVTCAGELTVTGEMVSGAAGAGDKRQARVWWVELDAKGRQVVAAGEGTVWVRFGCQVAGVRVTCARVLTAGPLPIPAVGTESLHAWECECGRAHTVSLRREWSGAGHDYLHVGVRPPTRRPSELLVALRNLRA